MTTLELPFISGVDEETEDKVLPAPRLTALENYRVVSPGSLECRAGVTQLGYGQTNLDGPRRMITHKDEILLIDDEKAYAYSSNQGFVEIEDSSALVLESSRSLGAYARHSVVATACASTIERLVHAWTTYDGTTYRLHITVEEVDGSALVQATEVPATSHAGMKCLKAASSGSSVIVMWGEGGNTVKGIVIDNNTAGAWVVGDITTFASDCDQTALNFFDLDGHSTGIVLAYASTTANTVKMDRLDASGTSQATGSINVGGATPRVGIVGDVGSNIHLHVVYGSGASSTHKLYELSASWSTTDSDTEGPGSSYDATLGIACGKYSGTASCIAYGISAVNMKLAIHDFAQAVQVSETIHHCYPCSKPFTRNGRVYVAVQARRDQANSHSAIVSVELSSGLFDRARMECRFNSSLSPSSPPDNIAVCIGEPYVSASSTSATKDSAYIIPIRRVDRVSDPSLLGVVKDGVGIISVVRAQEYVFNLNSGKQFMSAELGGQLYLGGGMVMQYDGRRLTEVGFSAYPDVQDADIAVATTGGSMVAGDYIYAFVWEWYDAAGNRHQSAPQIKTVTVGGTTTSKVTFTCNSLPLTRKQWRLDGDDARPMVLAIYRTEVGNEVLYRLEGSGSAPFVENDPTVANMGTYEDTYSDAQLLLNTRELLYTTTNGSNELDNVPPPPSRVLVAHGDRLIGIMDEDKTKLWYSKSLRNEMGLAWNESLVIQLETEATALASQDGNLLVFTDRGIFSIVGQGADNTGLGTGYEPPQRLSSETGCLEPRSVVTSPIGAFFQSHQGIMMLARGGFSAVHTPQIQKTLEAYPIITGAVHDQRNSRVCFSVVASEDQQSNSRVLVYDYGSKLWSVYNYVDSVTFRDLCIDNNTSGIAPDNAGLLCWASEGQGEQHLVVREDSGFDDFIRGGPGAFIDRFLETGDLRFSGIAGFARCYCATLMSEVLGSTDVTIRESHDSGATWDQTATWSLTASGEEYRQLTLLNQKHTQVRFRVSEGTSGTADSAGARLFGLAIDYAQLPGKVLMLDTERT